MFETRELRIGNLVLNKVGTICTVSQLSLEGNGLKISIRCEPTGSMSEEVSPIRITERVLAAAGFVKVKTKENKQVYKNHDLTLSGDYHQQTDYTERLRDQVEKLNSYTSCCRTFSRH